MEGYIDIKKLTLEELLGIVNLYPWFGGARKELCTRMAAMGNDAIGDEQFVAAAMYLPSRKKVSDIVRRASDRTLTDGDVETIVKSYVVDNKPVEEDNPAPVQRKRVFAGAGDYFSQEEYDNARHEEDNVFSRYAAKARKERAAQTVHSEPAFEFFTETLAQIYVEQGYYEHAKEIYSKLILAYPEKNAYFAALIQKLDELN
jgi:hypothetical protein